MGAGQDKDKESKQTPEDLQPGEESAEVKGGQHGSVGGGGRPRPMSWE